MMKILKLGVLLLAVSLPHLAETQELRPPEVKEVRGIPLAHVESEAAIAQLRENLKQLNVYIHYKAVCPSPSLILLSGKKEGIMICADILAAIDRAHAEPALMKPKVKYIPLSQVGSQSAMAMMKELQEMAGYGIGRGRFILYPEGDDAGLFFIGTADEVASITEFSGGIDRPQYRTRADILRNWWRDFSDDFLQSLQRVLSYLACAIFLLILHVIFCNIPFIGRKYRKYMGVIWGKLLAGFKGQDFALSLIETAASHGAAVASGMKLASGSDRFPVALEAAKRYLRFRGLDTRDADITAMLRDMLSACMSQGGITSGTSSHDT